ncbi:MAG: endolytic transglycosylase MltG [Patescibacteria group bacterium]|jgi:UPF0755 protein
MLLNRFQKKRKRDQRRKVNNACLVLLAFILVLVFGFISSNKTISFKKTKIFNFEVEKGQSVDIIAHNLKKEKIIRSKFKFKINVLLLGKQSSFKEGVYQLNSKMDVKEIIIELTPRTILKPETKLTFIEGWNLRDYAKLLEKNNLASSKDFFGLTGEPLSSYKNNLAKESFYDYSEDFSFLLDKPKGASLEGYLFPDTYNFYLSASVDEVIRKMLSNFDKKLTLKMREDIAKQEKTIYEIITMASVVEKEVQSEKDMKIVAGIFWDRIKNKQALESCATLAYILGVNKAQYSYEDTRIDSSYNTYINRGLPSGPIANPGIRAIEAVIYPEYTDFNYFLTNSQTGETVFSETYQEHLDNKNKYIK